MKIKIENQERKLKMKNYYLEKIFDSLIMSCLLMVGMCFVIALWAMALQSNYFIEYALAVTMTIAMVSVMYMCVSELISDIKDYRRNKK